MAAGWLSKFPKLHTILIGPHDLIFEARSIQNLEALSDVELVSAYPPPDTAMPQTAASTTPTPQTAERKSQFPVNGLHLLTDNPPPDGVLTFPHPDPDPDPELGPEVPPALPPIDDVLDAAYQTDPLAIEILQALRDGTRTNRKLSLADCREANGRLFYQDRFYIPEDPDHDLRLRLIHADHDAPIAGHPGRDKT